MKNGEGKNHYSIVGVPRDDVPLGVPPVFTMEHTSDHTHRYFVAIVPTSMRDGISHDAARWTILDECNTRREAESLARFWNRLERERS